MRRGGEERDGRCRGFRGVHGEASNDGSILVEIDGAICSLTLMNKGEVMNRSIDGRFRPSFQQFDFCNSGCSVFAALTSEQNSDIWQMCFGADFGRAPGMHQHFSTKHWSMHCHLGISTKEGEQLF